VAFPLVYLFKLELDSQSFPTTKERYEAGKLHPNLSLARQQDIRLTQSVVECLGPRFQPVRSTLLVNRAPGRLPQPTIRVN
jgi:hypothetical protein